jgi:hypothetical protein
MCEGRRKTVSVRREDGKGEKGEEQMSGPCVSKPKILLSFSFFPFPLFPFAYPALQMAE